MVAPATEPVDSDSPFDVTLVPASKTPVPASPSQSASVQASASATDAAAGATSGSPESSGTPTASAPATPAGRVIAFVQSVDVTKRALTYDQAQFFTGDAANKAAAADKQETPVPNDYYIRNVNKRLRTAPVAVDAAILGSIGLAEKVELTPKTLEDLRFYADLDQSAATPFWLTLDGAGSITRVEEQYVP